MKKSAYGFAFFMFLASCWLASCATQEQQATDNVATAKPATPVMPPKPGPFSGSLIYYYQLKDAFVASDATAADMTASQLRVSLDSLNTKKLNLDTTLNATIAGYKKTMLDAVDTLIKERDIQQKRKQFGIISDGLYSLMQAAPYKGAIVYQVHCPMAFDSGANWLNNVPVVNNPYYGSKMLTCGSVVDSLGR